MKQQLITYLLNGVDPTALIGCCLLAAVGIMLHLSWGIIKRKPLSERTPIDFSWKFFTRDNAERLVANLVLVFLGIPVAVIFYHQLTGGELNQWAGLGIGLFFDFWMKKLLTFGENKNDKMEETFEWALAANYEDDIALYNGEEYPLPVFAQQTMGLLTDKTIVYASEPAFTSIDFMSNHMAYYSAAPVKRPIKPI